MIQAMITGNIGKDSTIRDAGGTPFCSFNVASNKKIKGEDVTQWVKCDLWGTRGEKLAEYLTRGKRVAVCGELSTHEHEGKTYLDLRVDQLDFMSSKSDGDRSGAGRHRDEAAPASGNTSGGGDEYGDDAPDSSDLPF